jgi:hypothetical protein
MKLDRLETLRESIYWTLWSWWQGNFIATDAISWTPYRLSRQRKLEEKVKECRKIEKRWTALAPFFLTRGYLLHEILGSFQIVPPSAVRHNGSSYAPTFGPVKRGKATDIAIIVGWDSREVRDLTLALKDFHSFHAGTFECSQG